VLNCSLITRVKTRNEIQKERICYDGYCTRYWQNQERVSCVKSHIEIYIYVYMHMDTVISSSAVQVRLLYVQDFGIKFICT